MYQALSKTFLQTFWIKYFYKFFIKNIVKHLVTILPQIFNSSFPQIWVQKIGLNVAVVHTSQVRNSFNSNHIKPKWCDMDVCLFVGVSTPSFSSGVLRLIGECEVLLELA